MNAFVSNRLWHFASKGVFSRIFMTALTLGSIACHSQHPRKAAGGKASGRESVRVAEEFLGYSAAGDSARLASLARETVVSAVLLNHHLASTEHFRAAAETFRSGKVSAYPTGSGVQFRYRYLGNDYEGFITLQIYETRLVVSDFGIPAIID